MGNWRVILNFLLIHHPCSQTGFQIFHRNNFSWHKKKAPKDSSVTPQCGMLKQTKIIYISFLLWEDRHVTVVKSYIHLHKSSWLFSLVFNPPPPTKKNLQSWIGAVIADTESCKHFAVQRHWNIEVKKKNACLSKQQLANGNSRMYWLHCGS